MVMCLRAPRLLFNNTGAAKSKAKALYIAVAVFHFGHQLYGTSAAYKTMRAVHLRIAHRPVYGAEGALLVMSYHHYNAASLKLNSTCVPQCMYVLYVSTMCVCLELYHRAKALNPIRCTHNRANKKRTENQKVVVCAIDR